MFFLYIVFNNQDDNYLVIDDGTIDVDEPEQIELVNKGLRQPLKGGYNERRI